MALFDVLMPVRNGEAYIALAIASIQAQTLRDWRLLVLDHGSTDGTLAIVEGLARTDSRIELHPFPLAQGLSGLLNEGLALVRAPYALRMDADDECLPERMALTLAAFERHPQLAIVGGQALNIDGEGKASGRIPQPCDRDTLTRRVMFRNTFWHPTICFSSQRIVDMGIVYGRSIFRRTDPLATIEVPNLAEDYLLFGELAIAGLAMNVPQDLLRYRVHAGSVSKQKFAEQIKVTMQVARHLAAVLCRRAGVPCFDPVPFCSHGQVLTDVDGAASYRDEYDRMRTSLAAAGGAWQDDREVRWRETFVDRSAARIALRALSRYPACQPDAWELKTVLYSVAKIARGRQRLSVARGAAT